MSIHIFGVGILPFITYAYVLEIAKLKQSELPHSFELNTVNMKFHYPPIHRRESISSTNHLSLAQPNRRAHGSLLPNPFDSP